MLAVRVVCGYKIHSFHRLMKLRACLAILSIAFAGTSFAQGPNFAAAMIEKRFKELDVNGDGKLSVEEARSIAPLVAGADADGDGFLTMEEIKAHFQKAAGGVAKPQGLESLAAIFLPQIQGIFKSLDKDGNGRIEGDELKAAGWLAQLDTDGDGAVTLEEVTTTLSALTGGEPPASDEAPPPFAAPESPREGVRRVKATEAGVGAMVPDAAFADIDGKQHKLTDFTKGKATVIALFSPTCPVSKRYLPTLAALEKEWTPRGVGVLLVAPIATDAADDLRAAVKAAGLSATVVPDPKGALSAMLGARSTTDAFVLDARRTLVYRGAIDDQYGLGFSLDAPKKRHLTAALEATLAGIPPTIAATEAPGCALDLSAAPAVPGPEPTYHNRVSRLIAANCQECHRGGGVAPFPLENYAQVVAKAGMIRKMVDRQLMPPWFAKPLAGGHTPWVNDRALPERDRADLLAWLTTKTEGDAQDAPLPRSWPQEWQIGTPDAVVQIPEPIAVNAEGTMPYKIVQVATDFGGEKWVRGFEVRPSAREVVHHILVFAKPKGAPLGGADDVAGGFFAAFVPGNDHMVFPDGFAKLLPAGAVLHFQIHYTPNGKATQDQTKIGLLFAKEAPAHVVHVAGISNPRLKIPPGDPHYPASASIPVPRDVYLLGLFPHMHVRGSAFRYDLVLADGSARTLLEVPHYDFNWQLGYRYAVPPLLTAGSKVRATGWFDNSKNNPRNPDPSVEVHWGEQSWEEMMIGFFDVAIEPEGDKRKFFVR